MSKSETGYEFYSVNQVAVVLLLFAMVLMRDTIDNEIMEAICLACILSLIVKEVESNQDKNRVPAMKRDMTPAESGVGYSSDEDLADPLDDMEEDHPFSSTPEHHAHELEMNESLGSNSRIPPTRRPIDVYSRIPSGTEAPHHQGITWKPMPPKSIVPTKQPSNNEQSLSIRFVP